MWTIYKTLVIVLAALLVECQGDLKLVNSGYEGLVVSITNDIPQEHCNQIIHGLKSVLREFSNILWSSTEGRAYLRQVTVALPPSWRTDSLTCSLLTPVTPLSVPLDSYIHVTSPHPVFGVRPWTQQSQGCGHHGDYIQIGGDLLRATTNNTYDHVAQLLMAEWSKFKWGVFEERGYPDDQLYPMTFRDPITNNPLPNRCTKQNFILPFCPTSSHIPEAPTKHNAQCIGRSAWDIIEHSEDFINGSNKITNGTTPQLPSFTFVQESPPRFVLVVEDTAVMNLQQRWEFVRKAVRRVMVYDVPDGAHVALVIFNSQAKTTAPLMKMESLSDVRQRVGSSLPRNPSPVPESNKCILCGLQQGLRALNIDSPGATGATVILVTTGKGTASQDELDEMERLALQHRVRVEAVIYPVTENRGTATTTHGLESLIKATGGSSFTVMDEGVGNDSKVNMMVALMNALFSAVRHSSLPGTSKVPVLIHSNAYPGGIASMATGSFTLDESLGPSARFSVFYYDLNHVGNTVQLTSPSGHTIASVNMQEDGDANVLFVNIPKAERGTWTYQVENRADSHQGLHIQVVATESDARQISLRLWTSSDLSVINMTDSMTPVRVYAEVKDGLMPVLNARVTARLQRLGTNTTGSNYHSIIVELFDNGFGDPDITAGDGVYSRYLPTLKGASGHYELSVTADNNNDLAHSPVTDAFPGRSYSERDKVTCCGSKIKYEHTKPVSDFQRSTVYGVLDIVSPNDGIDIVPPNRILDLRSHVNQTTREVSLRWTAPGDDYDWDRARHYEGVLASSWAEAKAFSGERISGMPGPVLVGTEQSLMLQIDRYEQTIFVALRGVDEAGNRGGVSNIASFWVPPPPTTPAAVTSPNTLEPKINLAQPLGHEVFQPVRVAGLSLEDVAVISGSVVGFLIIMAALTTFCYCHVARHRRQQHKKDQERMEGNRNVMIKTNSTLMVGDEGQDSVDSAVKDDEVGLSKDGRPISPLQSWGASKLLQEHERRISVTSGPNMEASGPLPHCQNFQDPFPDVTLISTHPYPTSQTPSTTHSDPPAYHPTYLPEPHPSYSYPYHPGYSHEELPPYTPPGQPSQSSQASTVYTHEMGSQPSEISYQIDPMNYPTEMPSITAEIPYCQAPPPMYAPYPEQASFMPHASVQVKVPPPVAPKPSASARASAVASPTASVEPKRRNVTQV
ncbi:calcium-activated chloride channel regulator 1-like [Palaemon carinicauda]|uniref:calcium-activated chloride channel regulator 1-like n=1 Tax=Palaemon carinicauda TaxID=392227 RepID=UPI0035B59769